MDGLRLYTKVNDGLGFVADLGPRARGWRRSIRRNGGYWLGHFGYEGSEQDLIEAFQNWLGYHVEERAGGMKTWEGLVYELDLTVGGVTRRKSLDLLGNHVRAEYTDGSSVRQITSAATNDESIGRFGRKEVILSALDFLQTPAEAYRDSYLSEGAWPIARTVGLNKMGGAALDVTVAGYVHTAAWRNEQVGDGSSDNLSDWVDEIVTTDCEFLTSAVIEANTLAVDKDTVNYETAWDVLKKLVDLGDASGNRYRFHVGNDRRAYYEQIDISPSYYLRGGVLYTTPGSPASVDPWSVKPGVVRDFQYTGGDQYTGWLGSAKDFYLDEVEVGPGGLVLKTEAFAESDIMAAQQRYQKMLEQLRR